MVLLLAVLACGGSFSTANIQHAWLSTESSGTPKAVKFSQDQATIYCIVALANAPDDTAVKAVWTAVQAEGVDPDFKIDESELTSGDGTLTFNLTNNQLWPVGNYKVDLYLNGELNQTLHYSIE
jgi:hypothetical protein